MTYSEKRMDLFAVKGDWYLAHCIASDLRMGAGIAVPMQKKFGLRGQILASGESLDSPTCILTKRIFNLITKSRSSGKPTYQSIESSLMVMKSLVEENGVERVAIPRIGCGLDRLSWARVREILKDIFEDIDIEILVCKWK